MAKPAPVPADPAGARHSVSFRAGEPVFSEGEPGAHLFILEQGSVELTRGPSSERIAMLSPGDVFGESSLLEEVPRECTARAVSEATALRLDRAALDALLASPDVSLLLVRRLALRLREARLRPSAGARAAAVAATPAAAPRPAPARAGKLVHETTGSEFALPADRRVVVGRPGKGQTPDVDLSPIDLERSLSRRHAALWRDGERYFVCEENGVANGTFLNGHRLKAGEPAALADGDKVAFGLVRTVFHLD